MSGFKKEQIIPSHIRVTTQQDYPYSGYNILNGKLIGIGYAFDILNLMSEYFKFTYTIEIPTNKSYGLDEVVTMLINKEVDVAVAFLPIIPELRRTCIYGTVLDEMELTILMKRPPESATGSGLLAPFDTTVWILILITVLFIGPAFYLLVTLRSRFTKTPEKYSLHSCMWFVYGALLKQSSTLSPISSSIRLLFATWWIFNIILSAFYTANLTAFLTLSEFTLPITSLDSLITKHFKWFSFKKKVVDYMMEHNDSHLLDLQSTLGTYGEFIPNKNEIIDRTVLYKIQQNAVFITESLYAKLTLYEHYKEKMNQTIKEEERCQFVIMPNHLYKIDRAFAFADKSAIYYEFNKFTRKLIEGGLIKLFKNSQLPEADICPRDLGSKERNLRLADLKLTYIIVFAGFAIAMATFFGELLYQRFFKKNRVANQMKNAEKVLKSLKPMQGSWINAYENYIKDSTDYIHTIQVSSPKKVNSTIKKINGREYYIIKHDIIGFQLIPIRTPSAVMYKNYS